MCFAEDTVTTLKGISTEQLREMKQPRLIDGPLLKERARQLKSGLEALIHMSEMISEEHARKAMRAQISSIKTTLEQLEQVIELSPSIDYSLPAPLPTHGEDLRITQTSGETSTTRSKPPSDTTSSTSVAQEVSPMSSTTLSQYWSKLESAPFRDDKMAVIREVARDVYLTGQQAELLVEGLTFSKDRREALVTLYPRLVNPEDIQSLYHLLDHPAHQREVERRVEQVNMARRQRQAQGRP